MMNYIRENIIGTNYLSTIIQKKIVNYEITKENSIEIDSSYENINKITNYKYISDKKLEEQTKTFLINKCKKPVVHFANIDNKKNIIKNFEPINVQNTNNNKEMPIRASYDNISKISKYSKSNLEEMEHFKKGFIKNFTKSINQNQSNLKFIREFKNRLSLGGNCFTSKDLIKIEKKDESQKKKNEENSPKNNKNKNNKKKKKKNELEIITTNLQKSSQNLNQPDIFYAGLFSKLITKRGNEQNA